MWELRGTEPTRTGRQWPDQLVVGLQHLREVRQVLNDRLHMVVADEWPESRELGLALLQLTNLAEIAGELRTGRAPVESGAVQNGDSDRIRRLVRKAIDGYQGPRPMPDIDLLLAVLRGWFADAYEGWTPVLGKNRLIRGIEGLPEIGGGLVGQGKGDPRPMPPPVFELPPVEANVRRRIRVGVLDTPIFAHPALAGRYVVAGPDAYLPDQILDADPKPRRAGHGTFVAGLILQQAPDAQLEVRGVLDPTTANASAWDVATKMVQFRGSGVDILNMSFGCATDDGQPPLLLSRAVEQLSPEMVLIASAGNHGSVNEPEHAGHGLPKLPAETPYWPAAFQDVWAVGALDGDEPAEFSPRLPWVEFTAAGVDIPSTYLPGRVKIPERNQRGAITGYSAVDFGTGYAIWSGTSASAAIRSGDLATWAQQKSCTAREALDFLLTRSVDGPGGDSRPFQTEH